MPKLIPIVLAAAAASFATPRGAAAQGYVVIVNQAVPATSVAPSALGRIFEKRTISWSNGLAAEPVDLASNSPLRARFTRDVLDKSVAQAQAFWQAQVFSGHGVPPVELPTDAAVVQYVETHAGAVGYVASSTRLPDGVRRLKVSP